MRTKRLRVGTRDSILARLQTDLAISSLKESSSDLEFEFEILALKTSGDKILDRPLAELGGQGVFVKELEEALLAGKVDIVVHSLKDMPTVLPDSLHLGAVLKREDARDVLVSNEYSSFEDLPQGARLASSSRRRQAQLKALRRDLEFVDLRGNIQTRLKKLDEGNCQAIVLAAAGLIRLGLEGRICRYFSIDECTPAAGQGALAIECREKDEEIRQLLWQLNDEQAFAASQAERAFLKRLGGGCSVPVGAYARVELSPEKSLRLTGSITALDGGQVWKGSSFGPAVNAEAIGLALAEELLAQGAGQIISELLGTSAAVSAP